MKQLSPILTALLITALIGLGILLVGANALSNKNSVPISNSPASASTITSSLISSNSSSNPSQVAQLQNLVSQYQTQLNNETQQFSAPLVLHRLGVGSPKQTLRSYPTQGILIRFSPIHIITGDRLYHPSCRRIADRSLPSFYIGPDPCTVLLNLPTFLGGVRCDRFLFDPPGNGHLLYT